MSSSSSASPPARRVNLILDFDGTLTASDTLSLVAGIGYHKHRLDTPSLPAWSEIVSAYLSDLSAHISSYPQSPASRITFDSERAWLNSLLPIERGSARRAIDAGIWNGLSVEDVSQAAREALPAGSVQLREGWSSLLSLVGGQRRARGKVSVLSVNWSRWWIMSVLRAGVESHVDGDEKASVEAALDETDFYANELPSVVSEVEAMYSMKKFTQGKAVELRTSGDKVELLRQMRVSHAELVVYVGDSSTDLECLMEADVGICIRDAKMGSAQRELAETLGRIGEKVKHIADETGKQEEYGYQEKRLFWARNFGEIEAFLRRKLLCGEKNS